MNHIVSINLGHLYTYLYTYFLRLLNLAVHVGKAAIQPIAINLPVVSTPSNRMQLPHRINLKSRL